MRADERPRRRSNRPESRTLTRSPEPPPEAPVAHRPRLATPARAGRVEGGEAGEHRERTLDADEHAGTI